MPCYSVTLRKIKASCECVKALDKLQLVYGGSVLGSGEFSILPQLPHKILLASKVVKSDSNRLVFLV